MSRLMQKDKIVLLNEDTYRKMQLYIGASYLIGGASSAFAYYFPNLSNNRESMLAMIHGGMAICLIGIIILAAQLIKHQKMKEALILGVMLVSIPVITMQFIDYAGITVWVFPIVLIMASLVFNSRKYAALLTATAAITQVFVWIYAPRGAIYIDEFDYILRISILLLTFVVASFVNRIYIRKMEENIYQAKVIENMAFYDHLTKLPNRTLFFERLSQAIQEVKESEQCLGVIFLDLDGFKMVNDTMGHNSGDELLKEIAQRLLLRMRKSDTVARFGGDEFLILVTNLEDEKDITEIMGNIMIIFDKPFNVCGQEFRVTASAGVAMYPFDGADTESLIKNADIAMYSAKEKGKNQYVQCTNGMEEEVKKKVRLSNHLYEAQQRKELLLYYQPQVNTYTGEIVA